MADNSNIEWTDATWNPIRGCSRVSEGCRHCYAEGVAARFSKPGQAYEGLAAFKIIQPSQRELAGGPNTGHAGKAHREARWTGTIRVVPELLDQPLRWRRPRKIFVNSMSDLFHEGVSDDVLLLLFTVMANAHIATRGSDETHIFQVLTKRPQRMQQFVSRLRWSRGLGLTPIGERNYPVNYMPYLVEQPDTWQKVGGGPAHAKEMPAGWMPPQICLMVSVEDQPTADERIPLLLQTPARIRGISAEPLLAGIELLPSWILGFDYRGGYKVAAPRLDWVVAGGESGAGARPMHPEWARRLRDQCRGTGIPFFFKQWGAWAPAMQLPPDHMGATTPRKLIHKFDNGMVTQRFGKKISGRLLDGREWSEYPVVSRPSLNAEVGA